MARSRDRLTAQQEEFVRQYVIDWNAQRAAIAAGYSQKNVNSIAYQLLSKPKIRRAVEERKKQVEEKTWLSVDKVLRDLEELRREALENKDYKAAVKASELHGKYLGMWAERVEHQVTHSGSVTVGLCSAEEAKRILRQAFEDAVSHEQDGE